MSILTMKTIRGWRDNSLGLPQTNNEIMQYRKSFDGLFFNQLSADMEKHAFLAMEKALIMSDKNPNHPKSIEAMRIALEIVRKWRIVYGATQ